MEELKMCIPEMRYLRKYIKFKDRSNYVKYGSKKLFSCLVKVALNLMYANKNGIELNSKQIALLKKHKKSIIRLATSKDEKIQRRCLNNKTIDILLQIFLPVVADF